MGRGRLVRPRAHESYFYSTGFGYNLGYGYGSYYYRRGFVYPRPYGSYFYFGGYPWIYSSAWGYGQTPYYGNYGGGYARDYPDYYQGSLRLKIKPREAEVYVDGYYVGLVDSFDDVFERLQLEEGPHRIDIRHPDYKEIVRDVLIVAGETVTWEERMQPL